jgi:hypothetical protein
VSHLPSGDERMMKAVLGRHLGSQLPAGSCPDAELLAVYAEHRATAEERTLFEAHLATCLRCQAHLAALVRSEPPLLQGEHSASWFAGPWRWLVPAASAALVLLAVWVARSPMMSPQQEPLAQQVQPSTAPAAPAAPPAEPAVPAPKAEASAAERMNKEVSPPGAVDTRRTAETLQSAQAPPAAARDQRPPDRARPTGERSDVAANRNQERQSEPPGSELPGRSAAALARERREGLEEKVAVSSWRLAQGGAERTLDGGVSWTGRFRPAGSALRAISSPSPTVCWAVGDEGAVHYTRDGETWHRVAFPERVPLVAVEASDADRAVVTTADGRSFVTTDGGLTWRRVG